MRAKFESMLLMLICVGVMEPLFLPFAVIRVNPVLFQLGIPFFYWYPFAAFGIFWASIALLFTRVQPNRPHRKGKAK